MSIFFIEPIITKMKDILNTNMAAKLDEIYAEKADFDCEDIVNYYECQKGVIPQYPSIEIYPIDSPGEDYTPSTVRSDHSIGVRVWVAGLEGDEERQTKKVLRYLRAITEVIKETDDLESYVDLCKFDGHEYSDMTDPNGNVILGGVAKFIVDHEEAVQSVVTNTITVDSGTRTTNGQSSDFDVRRYMNGVFFINVSVGSGSLLVHIKTKDHVTGEYHIVDSFKAISGVDTDMLSVIGGLGEYIRFEWEISGSFTFSLTGYLTV